MNIGVNTRILLPGTLEGIGRFTHEVMQRITKKYPEHTFYFFFDREYDNKYVYHKNVIPVILSPQSRHPVLWYWWFEKSISKALLKHNIDVFFSPELYCCLSTDVPTLIVAHDVAYAHYPRHIPYSQQLYLKYFVPRFLQKADRIACVSEATMKDIEKTHSIPPEKMVVSHNGPTPGFRPMPLTKKQKVRKQITGGFPYFLYIGSMHPRKNIKRLLEAYNLFRKDNPLVNHKLVLVGRMAWKSKKIKNAYDSSPFKDDIILAGQREDAHAIMASAEALIYVSLLEGFGIPIIEAFSSDTAVITSDLSAMPEVAGDAAIFVNPKSITDIAHAMKQIATSENTKQKLIQRGRKELLRFSWDNTAKSIFTEIEKLAT